LETFKSHYESTIKYAGLERRCSDTIFQRDKITSTSTNQPSKYAGLKRRCNDAIYFQKAAIKNRNRFNLIFSSLVTLIIQVRRKFELLNILDLSDSILTLFLTRRGQKSKSLQFNIFYARYTHHTKQVRIDN